AGISPQDLGTNPQGQGKGWLYPSDPQASQPRHPKANHQIGTPFVKKRVGVDRAYPLKPVFHRKSRSTGAAGADGDQTGCARESQWLSSSGFGSRSPGHPAGVGPALAATQAQRAGANPPGPERLQIQRLEAAGESLEEEIRRKETLLREKLRKTEEELRRIQKEKGQAWGNETRESDTMAHSRRRAKGHSGSTSLSQLPSSPEVSPQEVSSREHLREVETWGGSQENSSPFQVSDYGMQRLKRERLVASNSKIRDQASALSTETCSQPPEAPGNTAWSAPSNSSPPKAPGSSGSSRFTEEPELGECCHCGRKFLLLRLERHSTVCSRVQGSKRTVFDSTRARAKGTELEQYLTWKGPASIKAEPPQKSNWRQKHESFIRTLRQAREVQQVIAKGGNPSDLLHILPAENPDYVQCPHCSRHFAPKVAERHIPKCKTIKNRPPPPRKHYS
ncbi:zinc finger C2HC domain-containing protein 1C, partial [Echinops telfairi]|uniref:Zinc finger C2HC domain-containing protein 1C n=1 Tax=Echinops telfairi TaxID=9371 RepID=A0ABM0IFT7_ECHTE